MKLITPALAGAVALALAAGSAFAERPKSDPGFNALDRNNDGYVSRVEAAKNPQLTKHFKQADRNGDGKLSRMEYLTVMTKGDLRNLSGKDKDRDRDRSASTGGSRPAK